jgi:diguanylate cyclase (GGDEF)-like protein
MPTIHVMRMGATPLARLSGLAISEERRLAGQVAGALYLVASATALLLLVLPHVEHDHWPVVVAAAAFGLIWGPICLTVIPWERAHPLVSHFSSCMGFPASIAVVAATGGASSPARFYGLFILVYAAYFYSEREAVPYVAAVIGMYALPLAYDSAAASSGYLAEVVVIAPSYAVLGVLLIAGKAVLVALREEARALALHDPLTGLDNRRSLMDELERHLGGRRIRDGVGLVLLDLDNFKDANTRFGHQGGDRVLAATAAGLRGAARETDVVARLGGDEFAVVAYDVDDETLHTLTERLLDAVRNAHAELDLSGLTLTASAGWARTARYAHTVEELVAVADEALRFAKRVGKNGGRGPQRQAAAA